MPLYQPPHLAGALHHLRPAAPARREAHAQQLHRPAQLPGPVRLSLAAGKARPGGHIVHRLPQLLLIGDVPAVLQGLSGKAPPLLIHGLAPDADGSPPGLHIPPAVRGAAQLGEKLPPDSVDTHKPPLQIVLGERHVGLLFPLPLLAPVDKEHADQPRQQAEGPEAPLEAPFGHILPVTALHVHKIRRGGQLGGVPLHPGARLLRQRPLPPGAHGIELLIDVPLLPLDVLQGLGKAAGHQLPAVQREHPVGLSIHIEIVRLVKRLPTAPDQQGKTVQSLHLLNGMGNGGVLQGCAAPAAGPQVQRPNIQPPAGPGQQEHDRRSEPRDVKYLVSCPQVL